MRLPAITLLFIAAPQLLSGQTDWPIYGHDPGGQQFSRLKQIDTKNVTNLKVAWTYDARPPAADAAAAAPAAPAASEANAAPPRPTRNRASQASPLVVGNVLYLGTPYNHVVALDADTGSKIWDYEGDAAPSTRGIAYWAGDKQLAPQVVVGTMNGWLYTLNAKTGKLNPGFGNEGKVNLKVGVSDNSPRGRYGMSSPPAIYKDLIFSGAQLQESRPIDPAAISGPGTSIRGSWSGHFTRFHAPGERNHEVWQEDQWQNRSAPTHGV